jgi:hypothetical protein
VPWRPEGIITQCPSHLILTAEVMLLVHVKFIVWILAPCHSVPLDKNQEVLIQLSIK